MLHLTQFFAACSSPTSFFGMPTWYEFLDSVDASTDVGSVCTPVVDSLTDIMLIGAAVLDMLVRAAAMVAIFMVVWGGIRYITSQGEPDKTEQARGTIINGIVGLVIAIAATATITFVAGSVN